MTSLFRIAVLIVAVALVAAGRVSVSANNPQAKDIVDTAVAAGSFKTLVAAVQAADLVAQLKSAGPFTVFAPTDEAFAKIPKADLDALIKDKLKLAKVLKHHVFAGNANSTDLGMLKDLSVASGGRLPILVGRGSLRIGGALVIKADVAASNGLIHVIDTVLIPK
ncbi:MAG TPA: fasciclin domain-containing protein [Vicinamibacterales bacterium]|nr:fasciclin domain-containing protein [Vicinamibacterales bacterium]